MGASSAVSSSGRVIGAVRPVPRERGTFGRSRPRRRMRSDVMKTIVVSGAHSNVGKTQLARELCGLLPGAVHVKIGHGKEKQNAGNLFFQVGTPFSRIEREIRHADFAVIESNSVLEVLAPDCTIYLPGGAPKPSAGRALEQADVVRGEQVSRKTIESLAGRLGLDEATVFEITLLAGAMREENS